MSTLAEIAAAFRDLREKEVAMQIARDALTDALNRAAQMSDNSDWRRGYVAGFDDRDPEVAALREGVAQARKEQDTLRAELASPKAQPTYQRERKAVLEAVRQARDGIYVSRPDLDDAITDAVMQCSVATQPTLEPLEPLDREKVRKAVMHFSEGGADA